MPAFEKEIHQLKELLQNEDDFATTFNYFFDQTDDPHFMKNSKKTKHPILKEAVGKIGSGYLKQEELKPTKMMIQKISPYKFFHGTCFLGRHLATFFYYDELDMGMFAMTGFTGTTEFFRFRASTYTSDNPLNFVPNDSQSLN